MSEHHALKDVLTQHLLLCKAQRHVFVLGEEQGAHEFEAAFREVDVQHRVPSVQLRQRPLHPSHMMFRQQGTASIFHMIAQETAWVLRKARLTELAPSIHKAKQSKQTNKNKKRQSEVRFHTLWVSRGGTERCNGISRRHGLYSLGYQLSDRG